MAIKDILVHVDSTKALSERLGYAISLAEKHNAHLTALYIVPKFPMPAYVDVPIGPGVVEEAMQLMREEADKTHKRVSEISGNTDVTLEWRQEEGDPDRIMTEHGRYADLIIMGQPNPDESGELGFWTTEHVLLNMGRPTLVVPYIGAPSEVGGRILVAWNGSAQAVRAINDAIPVLQKAQYVQVLSVNPRKSDMDEKQVPGADISHHLARHSVNVEAESMEATEASVANLLLSHVSDMSADMIVMGAYGHSRFREIVLGGVTRHLIRHMTVPVFMSH